MQAQARAPKSTLMMSDEEIEVRQWALRTVSKLMTFEHNHFLQNLEQNRRYLTEDTCRRYIWIMEAFKIRTGAEERQEDVTTGWDQKFPYKTTLGLMRMERVNDKRVEGYGLPDHARLWEIEIPLVIAFKKGIIERKYKFLTDVKVLKIGHGADDYLIYKWNPEADRFTIGMDSNNTVFRSSSYDECEEINFVELGFEDN